MAEDLQVIVTRWLAEFKRATGFDTWGQPVEAIEVYQRLAKQLHQYSSSENSSFTDYQKKTLEKVAVCIDSRERSLQSQKPAQSTSVSLNDLKCLEYTLQNVLGETKNDFPLYVSVAQVQYQQHLNQKDGSRHKNEEDKDDSQASERGSLLPRPLPVAGKTLLTVCVEKIGLKDASQFIDPFITISVKDCGGQDMTVSQDTPRAQHKQDTCVVFNVDVHIQKAVESLPPGFAVFFELKHFKPKKQMISTRCWACLEKDEISDGPIALELYKKPTDFRRKKKNINLLTVKPLYLHLRLHLCR